MDHAPPPPDTVRPAYNAPTRGIAVASVALGFFSMIVFWWKPFGGFLACTGMVLGLVSLLIGNKGGLRGENLALAGVGICAFSLTVIGALYFGLGAVMWGYYFW
jgi:hypothetical protein